MKTALQQLKERLEEIKNNDCKAVHELLFFDGILAVIEAGDYLKKEQEQLISAYDEGAKDFCNYDPERHGNESPTGDRYYSKTYKQA